MKIKTWIKYEEAYLPTPRCRKLRYRVCEEYVDIELAEVPFAVLRKAFEDKSYSGKGLIYSYNNRLWTAATIRDICGGGSNTERYTTPLGAMKWWNEHGSKFFCCGCFEHPNRNDMLAKVNAYMGNYLLVDGELYVCTGEPRYCIYTFGLGHNHGGTSLSVDYCYNPNITHKRYFSALDGEKAVIEANRIAAARGDTKDIGKFAAKIVVYLPECVTCDPVKDHGDGNELHNSFETIITGSESSDEAALLCMATTMF